VSKDEGNLKSEFSSKKKNNGSVADRVKKEQFENVALNKADLYENDFEQIIDLSNSITALPEKGLPTKDLLNNLEANLIRTALTQTDGNVSKAAELLQLGRTSLIQKINKYQLNIT
jgi:sigma-54 specific flagellar transcriptional regulator A